MAELPTAIASGGSTEPSADEVIVAVAPRRVALGAGALAALFILTVVTALPVPNRALALLGGPGDDFGRHGGLQMTWQPPPDLDGATLEARFAEREHGATLERTPAGYVVRVPRVAPGELARTAKRIGGTGRLEFHEVLQVPEMKQLARLLGLPMRDHPPVDLAVDQWRPELGGATETDYYLFGASRALIEAKLAEAAALGWKLPAGTHLIYEHLPAMRPGPEHWRTYVIADAVALDGQAIANAFGTADPNTNRPVVIVELDRAGAARFADLTARITGKKLAIVLDGEIRSAPIINERIGGGRASIMLGAGDPEEMIRDRDELVTTFSAGALPAGGTVADVRYVPPADVGATLWLARFGLALGGGILVGGLFGLAVKALRPHRRRVPRLTGDTRVWSRVAWTLGVIAVYLFGTQLALPGVNDAELAHVISKGGGSWHDLTAVSVFALGVMPLISSFVVVELAITLVPRWRRLRDGGPEARRKLGRVIAIAALGLATVQGYFVAVYMQALSRGGAEVLSTSIGARWLIVVTLVAGTAVIAWLASVIGHRGIGNGYAVLLLIGQAMRVPWLSLGALPAGELVLGLVTTAVIAVVVLVALRWRVAGIGGVAIPLPASGIAPLGDVGGIATAIAALAALGLTGLPIDWLYSLRGAVAGCVVIAVATVLWSLAFARPGRRRHELARAALAPPDRASWARAATLSVLVLVVLFVVGRAGRALPGLADPLVLVAAIATVADLVSELRDRRRGLVPVWPLHDPLLVDVVRDRLAAAAIPHHLQAARLRSLLWLFGSYVPIMVLVPADQAAIAERSLRDLLAPVSG